MPRWSEERREGRRERRKRRRARVHARRVPWLPFFGYYLALSLAFWGLYAASPLTREALFQSLSLPALSEAGGMLGLEGARAPVSSGVSRAPLSRGLTTLLVLLLALGLALPVAWAYRFTQRLRYDPSLVQTILILPIAVAGILLVVKNSLALAFSLAGIVAAVRFRNTLEEPKDAVYIFLAIGTGIAAGVQAADIALVLSLFFSTVVLLLWKHHVGSLPGKSGDPSALLSAGDPDLWLARGRLARQRLVSRLAPQVEGRKTDGVLLVQGVERESTCQATEAVLAELARDWVLLEEGEGAEGLVRLEFVLELKGKTSAVELLAELDERWGAQVAAAEFVPYESEAGER